MQWFSTWGRDPRMCREPLLERSQVDMFYAHNCITFALFDFYMGVIG